MCNLADYPLTYDKFTKNYYDRPISIASLYSSFSFLKVSKEIMSMIDRPKGLLVILYESEIHTQIHTDIKHVYCKYSEFDKVFVNSGDYNYFILNDITRLLGRVPKTDIYSDTEYPLNPVIYKNGPKPIPFNKTYIDSPRSGESDIMKINKTDLLLTLKDQSKITKFEDLCNKQFSYIYKISNITFDFVPREPSYSPPPL